MSLLPVPHRHRLSLRIALVATLALVGAGLPSHAVAHRITIVRDHFGVPHIYGDTAQDVSYGAGYALAQDRLWQLHTFRLIAKGQLSELIGPPVEDIDKTVRFFTYTSAERARRFATYPTEIKANLQAFADGINAWIAQVKSDPSKLPFEFTEFGVGPPADWSVDDSVALEDVLILAFGSGGGEELQHAALLQALINLYGKADGARRFNDLVMTNDPDSPVSIPREYDYRHAPTFARASEASARRALTPDARLSLPQDKTATASAPFARAAVTGALAQLSLIPDPGAALRASRPILDGLNRLQRAFSFGSNAQIVSSKLSATGNTLQTAGPQVGYLLPQWLADFGLHSADGKLDAIGMTFAGAGPAVLIGRGNGFAWTTTTGASDLTDTYVEKLNPKNDHQFAFNGRWLTMDCRTETYTVRGAPFDSQEICRTIHGPVLSIDSAHHVAYSLRYAWFNREGQTVEGFFGYNNVHSVQDFATDANMLASNHNMFYVDDRGNYGYWHPGNFPVHARGVDIRLPQDGTGRSEWRGLLPIQETPHAVNFSRGWLANWNNQPAAGWQREESWAVAQHSVDLMRTLDPSKPAVADPFGGLINSDRRPNFEDLSANLRFAAFRDHDDSFFRPFLPSDAALKTALAKKAAAVIRSWDGFLVDRNDDGLYDSAGHTIEQQWLTNMHANAFKPNLGDQAAAASESLLWHVLAPNDSLRLTTDWLNGHKPLALTAGSFEQAVTELAKKFGNSDPASWREKIAKEHYQRLNADLFTDTVQTTIGADPSGDSGFPGDVPDRIEMDRGTYNHVVAYGPARPGRSLGTASVQAGSVIPPGQSGFIDFAGQEDPHYRDQLALYVGWRYKPMPMTLPEALALKESVTVLMR